MARKAGQRLRGTFMPKGFDGIKSVRVQCSEDTFNALKLSEMPLPQEGFKVVGNYVVRIMETRAMGADSMRYRVLWPDAAGRTPGKLRSSSFTLSGKHSNETLFVLAEHLRVQEVDFFAIANRHGNAFHSVLLHGADTFHLTGDMGHAIRSDFKLLTEPAPVNVGACGL